MFSKVNDAYQTVKNGLEAEVALATAEEKEKLADAKLALADIKDYLAELKDENRELKDQISKKDSYLLENSVYWSSADKDRKQPFCPACFAEGKISPMEPDVRDSHSTVYRCPISPSHVSNPWGYQPQPYTPSAGISSMFNYDERY